MKLATRKPVDPLARVLPRPSLTDWLDNPRARRSGKYNNEHCEVDGEKFDSKAEAKRWCELRLLAKAREITDLKRQVPYLLVPKTARPSGGFERECSYVADFTYTDRTGRSVVEDVKGATTPEFVIKRKLMLHLHGIEVRLVKARP